MISYIRRDELRGKKRNPTTEGRAKMASTITA